MLCAPDGGCCVLKVMAVVVCLVGDAVFKGSWLLLWAQWHTCHISHCEIKSHRIWPIWKAIPIKNSNLTEFSDYFTTDFMKK